MGDFDNYKKYIVNKDEDRENDEFEFYRIQIKEIEEAEKKLRIKFPKELHDFYTEIGYGFARHDMYDIHYFSNRIMAPLDILSFITDEDVYKNDERRIDYKDYKNQLPFYEVSEVSLLTIDLEESKLDGKCKIYYFDDKIANSLLEFLDKMKIKADYYIEDDNE